MARSTPYRRRTVLGAASQALTKFWMSLGV
jgi:hypothetical protein